VFDGHYPVLIDWNYCFFKRCGHNSHPLHNRLQCYAHAEEVMNSTGFFRTPVSVIQAVYIFTSCKVHLLLILETTCKCQLLTSPHWGKSFCVTLVLYGLSCKRFVALWAEEFDTTLWTANWQKRFSGTCSYSSAKFLCLHFVSEPIVWNVSLFCMSF